MEKNQENPLAGLVEYPVLPQDSYKIPAPDLITPSLRLNDPMLHILGEKTTESGSISAQGVFPDYVLTVPEKVLNDDPFIDAIVKSGKKVEELSQEELRSVYHYISGNMIRKVYSASAVNHIARTGRYPEYTDSPEGDSLFIGDQVHKAMEVDGANIRKIRIYEELGSAPEKPNLEGLTPDNVKILELCAMGATPTQAYCEIKSNKTIDDVDSLELKKYYNDPSGHAPSKELVKLITAATKEAAKSTLFVPAYRVYLDKVADLEKKKEALRKGDYVILDDLSYRSMSAARMKETIVRTYEALRQNTVVMNTYRYGYANQIDGIQMESYTEFVVLWKHKINDRKYVPCKSMFDRLHLDFTNKVAIIQDIKTHSKMGRQFVSGNYFDYGYFRSMAFYRQAVIEYLIQRGEDASAWNVYAVLLPVSTTTFEVGCFNPTVIISSQDMNMGTNGGYMKPIGTKFNRNGEAQWALDSIQFDKLEQLGIIHQNAYEYYLKGWKMCIEEVENLFNLPTNE
jgi:hypothetical protein